jgi:hypothetical protein
VKFRLIGPLGKIYNIVVYIRGLTARIAEFLELVGRRILLDNCTRWNSWDTMLVIALELRLVVEQYF